MRVSEIYPRAWLRVGDLEPGRVYRAAIVAVAVRNVMGRGRIVISVRGRDGQRDIYLNRSSAWALAERLGDDVGGWPGREVIFRRAKVAGREAILVTAADQIKT